MKLDIVAIGEPLVEFNQTTSEAPATFKLGHGGDTSNAAIAAARQGAKVGYFTALGKDAFAESFLALWQREGVDASQVITDPDAPTGAYFVTHGATGHVFSYMRAGSAASRLSPAKLPLEYISSSRILHVSGISQAISTSACDAVFAAIDSAKKAGVKVAYDINFRPKLWPIARARAIINETIQRSDIVLPSLEDAHALTGLSDPDQIIAHYLSQGASYVVLKLGSNGVIVSTDSDRCAIPGIPVEAVDATGAGDAFDGAFLSMVANGSNLVEAAEYANAAAALSTLGFGAVDPIPTRAAVLKFLEHQQQ